ncbi:cupin domain-containing protein [Octadecabacter sp.]|nr:cupin domain-containing protein [Octadecabacter sp.]
MTLTDTHFDQPVDALSAGHWVKDNEGGADRPAGLGSIGAGRGLGVFVTHNEIVGTGVLGSHAIQMPDGPWALRMDEVAFPVGAIAHRHIHSGSGWRYLVSGSLRIESSTGDQTMQAGNSWFEPANTPVRAVSLHQTGVTRFVRAMVIPQSAMGQSTFQLCDPADGTLPRLQVTHLHFDLPYQVDAG